MRRMEPVTLTSASEVIDALGGTVEAARKCEKSPQTVTNWRTRGIPPEMFLIVNEKLADKGVAAPSAFAGMIAPVSAGAAA